MYRTFVPSQAAHSYLTAARDVSTVRLFLFCVTVPAAIYARGHKPQVARGVGAALTKHGLMIYVFTSAINAFRVHSASGSLAIHA